MSPGLGLLLGLPFSLAPALNPNCASCHILARIDSGVNDIYVVEILPTETASDIQTKSRTIDPPPG